MFMRLLFKATLPLIMVLGMISYVMYLNGHHPFQIFSTVSLPQQASTFMNEINRSADSAGEVVFQRQKETIYKWQDEHGQWHYGKIRPLNAALAEAVTIDPNVNVIGSVNRQRHLTTSPPEPTRAEAERPVVDNSASLPKGFEAYSPDNVKKLFEDTKQVQQTLVERQQAQWDAIKR